MTEANTPDTISNVTVMCYNWRDLSLMILLFGWFTQNPLEVGSLVELFCHTGFEKNG